MFLEHLAVEVRNRNYERVGVIDHAYLDIHFTMRHCDVGEWEINIPHSHPMSAELGKPGSGIIVLYRGACIMSGPMTSAEVSANEDGTEVSNVKGVCDNVHMQDRLIKPGGGGGGIEAQPAEDVWSVSDLTPFGSVWFAVNQAMGPVAHADRKHPLLRMEPTGPSGSWQVGNTQSWSSRWGSVIDCSRAMRERGDEAWVIEQDETTNGIVFRRRVPIDTQGRVRFDNSRLGGVETTGAKIGAPGITRAVVAGEGHLKYRVIKQVKAEDAGLEALWGHRFIEQFIDQRTTVAEAELTDAGREALADGGARTQVAQSIELTEDSRYEFNTDFSLGSLVRIIDGGEELEAKVYGVACMVNSDGVRVGIQVGGADINQDRIETRVASLERSEYTGAGPWKNLTTTASWSVFPFRQIQYRVSNGEVIMRGGIMAGALGSAVVLPADIVPDRNQEMLVPAGTGAARVTIESGTARLNVDSYISGGSNSYVSLLGIRYFIS